MHNDEYKTEQEGQKEKRVLEMIQSIKDGDLDPKILSKDEVEECVEFLDEEGYKQAQIGEILKRTDRTIRRDLVEISKKRALSPDGEQAKRIIGQMYHGAMARYRYLLRLARDPEATITEKDNAEFDAWRVLKEMIEKLQNLMYLPKKSSTLTADIYHHHEEGGETKTYAQLKEDLREIEKVAKEAGTLDPKLKENIKLLQERIEKSEISEKIVDLKKDKNNEDKKEEGNKNAE